jgi:hypothetical protein
MIVPEPGPSMDVHRFATTSVKVKPAALDEERTQTCKLADAHANLYAVCACAPRFAFLGGQLCLCGLLPGTL